MRIIERYLINSVGDDLQATNRGVAEFYKLCQKYGDGVIYVPEMQNIKSTLLATAVGKEVVKSLSKHKSVTLSTGQPIELCSDRTFKNYRLGSVYLALWATPGMIENIEKDAYKCKAIVVVTWTENDADAWVTSKNPTQLMWK